MPARRNADRAIWPTVGRLPLECYQHVRENTRCKNASRGRQLGDCGGKSIRPCPDGAMSLDTKWKAILWQQFGAAIDMLENALVACPDELWSDRSRHPEFWYLVFHTLFFLDLYLSGSV